MYAPVSTAEERHRLDWRRDPWQAYLCTLLYLVMYICLYVLSFTVSFMEVTHTALQPGTTTVMAFNSVSTQSYPENDKVSTTKPTWRHNWEYIGLGLRCFSLLLLVIGFMVNVNRMCSRLYLVYPPALPASFGILAGVMGIYSELVLGLSEVLHSPNAVVVQSLIFCSTTSIFCLLMGVFVYKLTVPRLSETANGENSRLVEDSARNNAEQANDLTGRLGRLETQRNEGTQTSEENNSRNLTCTHVVAEGHNSTPIRIGGNQTDEHTHGSLNHIRDSSREQPSTSVSKHDCRHHETRGRIADAQNSICDEWHSCSPGGHLNGDRNLPLDGISVICKLEEDSKCKREELPAEGLPNGRALVKRGTSIESNVPGGGEYSNYRVLEEGIDFIVEGRGRDDVANGVNGTVQHGIDNLGFQESNNVSEFETGFVDDASFYQSSDDHMLEKFVRNSQDYTDRQSDGSHSSGTSMSSTRRLILTEKETLTFLGTDEEFLGTLDDKDLDKNRTWP